MAILADKTREELLKVLPGELPPASEAIINQIEELEAKVEWFEEQHRLALHRQFGPSSEPTPVGQEALLFNEAEAVAQPRLPEPTVETITHTRRKVKGHREAQVANLPVKEIDYRLPEEEQVCPECSGALHEMGVEVRQEIQIVPATITLVKHNRFKYACRHCQQEETTTPIVTATMPNPAFPNSVASPSAVAHIMTQKFVESQPLYRQEQHWQREGIDISRQTMANWMIRGAEMLADIYDAMRIALLKLDIVHADETTLQVLKEPGRAAQTDSYMWLYRSGREGPPMALFEYQPGRAGQYPKRFLEGFKGYLQVDGYEAYGQVANAILVGCWAHARRKFMDALKAMPKSPKKAGAAVVAELGLQYCNTLFSIEGDLHDVTHRERFEGRQARSKPVLDQFKAWLDDQANRTLPKSAVGQAITYCRNQWDKLTVFLTDGRLELDNNRSERSIKSFVVGRKNWLFANTPKGAKASAIIYSIVETAKENGLRPHAYLTFLFEQLPNIDRQDPKAIEALMPWAEHVQAGLKSRAN